MRKMTLYILLVLAGIVFTMDGCKKEKKVDNCATLSAAASDAAEAFIANMNQETCEAYVDAIQDFYDGCATITPALRAQYDAALESMECSGF